MAPKNPVAEEQNKTEDAATEAYKPVGKVVELASAKRGKETTRVLQDDKRVWKETA